MGVPAGEYGPSENAPRALPGIRPPGESRYACAAKRVDILATIRPLYQNIFGESDHQCGERNGISTGHLLGGSDTADYCDTPILEKKPIRILPSRVYKSGSFVPMMSEGCGGFDYPTHGRLIVSNIGPSST